MAGCQRWSALARESEIGAEIIQYNTACVLFAVSSIEARVNEWISICAEIEDADISEDFWRELGVQQKSLTLKGKWNLIASVSKGTK